VPDSELKNSYQFCKQKTKQHATSFYFAGRILDRSERYSAYAIYAFCRFSDSLVDESRVSEEKISKNLEKWTNFTKKALNNQDCQISDLELLNSTDQSEAEQILPAFLDTFKKYKLKPEYFLDLLKGVKMDLTVNRYQTWSELEEYCYFVAGTVGLMMTSLIGYSDPKAFEYAKNMGIALQLTNILRDVGEDLEERSRIYLPQQDLQKFGVDLENINHNEVKLNQNFIDLMQFFIQKNRDIYNQNWHGFEFLNSRGRFGLKSACKIYSKILDKIEENNYNVLHKRAFTRKREKLWEVLKIVVDK